MTSLENKTPTEITPPKNYFGRRHIQYMLLFFISIIDYGIRTNMSVGIIAMMDKKQTNPSIPTYPNWTQTDKQLIISSFFWGYIIPQIGAGAIIKRFGPKWFLFGTTMINALATGLVPVFADGLGANGVIISRFLQGISQGFLFPSVHNLLGRWVPTPERATIASFVYTGGPLGTVISLPVTGWISESSVGWPTAFYLYGGLTFVWALLFMWLGANSPAECKHISEEEKNYIEGYTMVGGDTNSVATPWKSIWTSMPFWAILIAHCGQNWGFWTLLAEIPSYMEKILKFKISDNSLLSALPYFALWILNFAMSPLADFVVTRGYLSNTTTRKVFNSLGLIVPAISLTVISFVDTTERTLIVALLVVAVGSNAGVYSGFNVNHIDLSPTHAGVLMGITNSISNVFSIVAPFVIEAIPRSETDPILWRFVFLIAAGFYVVSAIFYDIFASGDVQSWDKEGVEETQRKSMAKV